MKRFMSIIVTLITLITTSLNVNAFEYGARPSDEIKESVISDPMIQVDDMVFYTDCSMTLEEVTDVIANSKNNLNLEFEFIDGSEFDTNLFDMNTFTYNVYRTGESNKYISMVFIDVTNSEDPYDSVLLTVNADSKKYNNYNMKDNKTNRSDIYYGNSISPYSYYTKKEIDSFLKYYYRDDETVFEEPAVYYTVHDNEISLQVPQFIGYDNYYLNRYYTFEEVQYNTYKLKSVSIEREYKN